MISVIIPTYKRSDYIERAINSVLHQTYQDFEIIVVDDNNPGTDERTELEKKMRKFEKNPKIHYIQHDKNRNGAVARNTGIKNAKGDYIAFLDDDDFYIQDRLETLYKVLEQNKQYDAAYSDTVIINAKGEIVEIVEAKEYGDISKKMLLKETTIGTGSNLFFRAKALKDIGGFNEELKRHQDIEIVVRFCQKYKILNINKLLVVKDNGNRINKLKSVDELLETKEKYMKEFEKYVQKYPENEKNKFYFVHYLEILYLIRSNGEINKISVIKEKINKYGKINLKIKIKLLRYGIYKFLRIDLMKEKFKNKIIRKNISQDIINEIDKNTHRRSI